MTTRKKTIKKPSFITIYFISFFIVSLLLFGVGALIYNNEKTKFNSKLSEHSRELYSDVTGNIFDFLEKDKEKVTEADIVLLKHRLVLYYSWTGQYIEVYRGTELVADAKISAFLDYYDRTDEHGSSTYYVLGIADNKYMEYLYTPETLKYRGAIQDGYGDYHDGFRTKPGLDFYCTEFYADFENNKFIPVNVTFWRYRIDEPGATLNIKIAPDPKDIEGYTLININDNSGDTADGYVVGLEGKINGPMEDAGRSLDGNGYYNETKLSVKEFEEKYGNEIKEGIVIRVLGSLFISLIPATIRYNINKRNYEIFQYRLKTTNAMAHDLKTPLASIIAYTEILNNNIDVANREHYLTKISDTASQMNSIVNGILQFSRSENATAPVNKSEVAVPELISGIIDENEQQISEKALKVDFDNTEELKLNTDKELLHQALGNLINNAVKHAKEGTTVQIKYSAETITITNEPAEPIEDITKIKEPFIKGNSSRQNGGTGLGLAIADNDLAMLGYKLDIGCEGNEFTATIKLGK